MADRHLGGLCSRVGDLHRRFSGGKGNRLNRTFGRAVGIEPTTSSMPWKRAPRCATGPRLKTKSPRPPNRDRGKYRIHFRRWHSTPTRHFTSRVPRLGFQQSSQLVSISATRRDHRSFCQYDVVYPIEHRTNLANAGTVHDGRFPHSDEVVWRQLLFQVCQGFPQQVTVAGGVYAGIVSRGFDPQNVGDGNKENPLLVLYHKAFQRAKTTEGLEQWFETSICFPALFEDLACVNQGLGKSLLIIRFQEIVNSVHFECTNGVHIVSRDEDIYGSGAGRWLHIFDDSKTIQIRHQHIEKNDVGMKFIDLLHRTYSVRRLAYNFNAVVFGQIATDTAAGDRFVIDDEDSCLHVNSSVEW